MKIIITGANGQLGTDLCKALSHSDLVPLTHKDIEITAMNSVKQVFGRYKPDVVINTVAFVRVDDCETEQDRAFRVNALGARNIAVAAQELGAKLVHMSTDYVFGGAGETLVVSRQGSRDKPHPYTEFDVPIPLSIYGKSKLAGESFVRHLCQRHFIIRTSGLFGLAGSTGKGGNFVDTMLKLAKERDELRVVNDQIFSPTCSKDLARKIALLIETEYYGTFHITNKGTCSWYDFTREILKQAGLKTPVTPISSGEYPQKAKRPRFSVLDNYQLRLLGMDDMRPWQEALKDYMRNKTSLE